MFLCNRQEVMHGERSVWRMYNQGQIQKIQKVRAADSGFDKDAWMKISVRRAIFSQNFRWRGGGGAGSVPPKSARDNVKLKLFSLYIYIKIWDALIHELP